MSDLLKPSDSPQIKVLNEWLRGLQTRDMDLIAKCLHKDFRNTVHPQSLGKPERTKEEWLEDLVGLLNLWTKRELTVHSITEAPGKIILHVTNTAQTSVGIEVVRESIFIKHFAADEDGTLKIKRDEEFTDSKAYLDAIQAVAAAKAKGQQ